MVVSTADIQWDRIQELVDQKLIYKYAHHEVHGAYILNYAPRVQFNKMWELATMQCRGLVVDWEGKEVLARPFPKFFNFSEVFPGLTLDVLDGSEYTVHEKMDGVLGIVAFYGAKWRVTTRGRSDSPMALWAQEVLDRNPPADEHRGLTFCVEIVYPGSRVVVDYGGREELVWLATFRVDGCELDVAPDCFGRASAFEFTTLGELPRTLRNFEGFVIRVRGETGYTRYKVKMDEYLQLHRALLYWSPRRAWGLLRDGVDPLDVVAQLPDELHAQAWEDVRLLRAEYNRILTLSRELLQSCLGVDRKDTAQKLLQSGNLYTRVSLALLSGREPRGMIWGLCRPKNA